MPLGVAPTPCQSVTPTMRNAHAHRRNGQPVTGLICTPPSPDQQVTAPPLAATAHAGVGPRDRGSWQPRAHRPPVRCLGASHLPRAERRWFSRATVHNASDAESSGAGVFQVR